jgi:transcriptional regulator with XRE-family HTH domain
VYCLAIAVFSYSCGSLFQTEIRGEAILTFRDARLRLLAYVRDQVRNGELTERRLARLIGISQPHAHNVLKGVRTLSPEIFDLVLKYLHLSLLDLAPIEDLEAQLQRRRARQRLAEVAFLATPIGPGRPWPAGVNWQQSFPVPLPSGTVPPTLVMAKLAADPAMISTLESYDIALLDTSGAQRSAISAQGLYVIERTGEAVLRYIRPGTRCYYLVADADSDRPAAWERLALSSAQLGEAVKARVIWLGRERDRDAQPQRGRFLYAPISS